MERFTKPVLAALAFAVVLSYSLASTSALQLTAATSAVTVGTPVSLEEVVVEADRVPGPSEEDILWLARCIYSETNRPDEQELVAWVVRNRVDTEYRGKTTYEGAVLDPWQFSAFNENSPKRTFFLSLERDSREPGWQTALAIAERVAKAHPDERPFTETTRHFYSERSMVGTRAPNWANNRRPVPLNQEIDPQRFRFFANIS